MEKVKYYAKVCRTHTQLMLNPRENYAKESD